jgi:HTH-type transcriptional regulator/antitoxin HipB
MKPIEIAVRSAAQLGNALARIRKLEGSTQSHVGEQAGIKQGGVSSVERGADGSRVGTIFKLLAALDLELVIRRRQKQDWR